MAVLPGFEGAELEMDDLENSVAIVTGGASGIGFALAQEAQSRGCKLVLGDIREDALKEAEAKLSANGEVLTCKVDVSRADDIESLAEAAVDRFGKVNVLFNNAGVFASGLTWETSVEQYDWMIGINQRSVMHGIRSFVPRMIAQGDECHVVTISSGAGISVNPGFCMYSMTKHAALALTEALYLDLTTQGVSNIGVTIAMPGMVQTNIMSAQKPVLGELQTDIDNRKTNALLSALEKVMTSGVEDGVPADELARTVFEAVEQNDLYVLPGLDSEEARSRMTAIGIGRATRENPYSFALKNLLSKLRENDPSL